MRYGSSWGPPHKSFSSNAKTVLFDADEYITGIEAHMSSDWPTFQGMKIYTNKNTYGIYGDSSSKVIKSHCRHNERLAYITGRQALWYDHLKFHFVEV